MKEKLQKQLDKNREEIDRLLESNMPLELLYIRIRMLTALNKNLIARISEY